MAFTYKDEERSFTHRIPGFRLDGNGKIGRLTLLTEKGEIETEYRPTLDPTVAERSRTWIGWTATIVASVMFAPVTLTAALIFSLVGAAYAAYVASLPKNAGGYYIHNRNHDKPLLPANEPLDPLDLVEEKEDDMDINGKPLLAEQGPVVSPAVVEQEDEEGAVAAP